MEEEQGEGRGRLAAVDLIGGTRMAKGAAGAAGNMCAGRCGRGLVRVMRVPRRPRCGEEEDGQKNDWKQLSRRLVFFLRGAASIASRTIDTIAGPTRVRRNVSAGASSENVSLRVVTPRIQTHAIAF